METKKLTKSRSTQIDPKALLKSTQEILNHMKTDISNVSGFMKRQEKINQLMNELLGKIDKKMQMTNKEEEPQFTNNIDKDYLLKCTVQHFGMDEGNRQLFFKGIQELMKKYGVFEVTGVLLKKF